MSIKYIFYLSSRQGGGKIVKTRQKFEPAEHVLEKDSRQNLQIRDQACAQKKRQPHRGDAAAAGVQNFG